MPYGTSGIPWAPMRIQGMLAGSQFALLKNR